MESEIYLKDIVIDLCSKSKEEFTREYEKFDEKFSQNVKLEILAQIEYSISIEKIEESLNKLIKLLNHINLIQTESALDETPSTICTTSFLINLACKFNKIKVLTWIFNKYKHLELPCCNTKGRACMLTSDVDKHNPFYYSIRSGNVELLETLINKWPGDYWTSHSEELEDLLAEAYEELKLKNVLLSYEMKYFVEDKIINLRFFSTKSEDYMPSIDNILQRIDLVLEIFAQLQSEYSNEDVDERFLFITRFIAEQLYILKRQLKFTFNKLPWEEIEFCIVSFISSYIKPQEINLFYRYVLNKKRILDHLKLFFIELKNTRFEITGMNINELLKLPNLKREDVIADIMNSCKSFQDVYADYKIIRDIHSLQKMNKYINLALVSNCNTEEDIIIIIRTLQIIGELLKNTLESPKMSSTTSDLLIFSAPGSTREILIDLRNSLSHSHSLSSRSEIEKNMDNAFYINIQSDLKKINSVITNILFRNKIKILLTLLTKFVNSKSFNEADEFFSIFNTISFDELLKDSSNFSTEREYATIIEMINELREKLCEKTEFEEQMFNKIMHELTSVMLENEDPNDYMLCLLSLKNLSVNFYDFKIDKNYILNAKFLVNNTINEMNTLQQSYLRKKLKNIGKMFKDIFISVRSRLQTDDRLHILRLFMNIFYATEFEEDNINIIEELRESLKTQKKKKSVVKDRDRKVIQSIISNKLLTINKILKEAKLSHKFQNKILNKVNSKIKIKINKTNSKMQAVIEMLVLDCLCYLEQSNKRLTNNILIFDEYSPLLCGKSLRNHLAHGNALIDIQPFDSSLAVFVNAKIFSNLKFNEDYQMIGKLIQDHIPGLRIKFHLSLARFDVQRKMFAACEEGNLDDVKRQIEKGADINAKDNNLRTSVHYAAKGLCIDVMKFIFTQNINFEALDRSSKTSLHIAAFYGRENIVEFLIKKKFNINAIDNYGRMPIHLASMNGHKQVVEMLINFKSNICLDLAGGHPLHLAAQNNHQGIIEIFLSHGMNVNFENCGGFTPLHIAAEHGHIELVKFLLKNNANVNAENGRGGIPLHTTALNGHVDIVKLLVFNGSNVNKQTFNGGTALRYATENGHEEIAQDLLDHGANVNAVDKIYNCSALHNAAKYGCKNVAKLLLQRGANVNQTSSKGISPIHIAAAYGHVDIVNLLIDCKANVNAETNCETTALHYSALNNNSDTIKMLIKHGANVNKKNKNGCTALHISSLTGNIEVVKALITAGSFINEDGNDGNALHLSVSRNHKDVLDVLLENGADINAKNNRDWTVLHFASLNKNVEHILNISNLLDINTNLHDNIDLPLFQSSSKYRSFEIIKFLLSYEVNINALDEDGCTPLIIAAFSGNSEVVETLIKNDANINLQTKDGLTALHSAITSKQTEIARNLIIHGAEVNIMDNLRSTPLHHAVKSNNLEIVNILLKHGSDVNVDGKLIEFSINTGFKNIVKVLLKQPLITAETLNRSLGAACTKGFTNIVEDLIEKGADINLLKKYILSPLSHAMVGNHKTVMELLIRKGADVNALYIMGSKLLHFAAEYGCENTVEVLVKNGADVHAKNFKNRTPIELAIANNHLSIVKIILNYHNVNINFKGIDNFSLLHISAQAGNLELTKYLVNNKADIKAKNSHGSKPIHIAAREGNLEVVKYFLKIGCNINDRGCANWTLLHYAAIGGSLDVAEYLINKNRDVNAIDIYGFRPIYYSVIYGFQDLTELLINNGSFYKINFNEIKDSLHVKEDKNNVLKFLTATDKLFDAIKFNNQELVKVCINEKAYINAKNTENESPLHFATRKGYETIVNKILENKANPNVVGKDGCTPLHYASKYNRFNIAISLLSHGAIYTSKTFENETPLDFACNGKMKSMLTLIKNSFENIESNNLKVIGHLMKVKDVNKIKAVVNAHNKDNKSLILVAIQKDFPMLKQLRQVFENKDNDDIYKAEQLISQEKYKEAMIIFNMLLEKRKDFFGLYSPATLDIQVRFANMIYKTGNYQEALKIYEDSYQKQKDILGQNHEDTLKTNNRIALILYRLGKNHEALVIFKDVVREQEKILGIYNFEILETKVNMALALAGLNKYEDALNVNCEVLEKYKEKFGFNHPCTLISYNNIALVFNQQGRHEEALEIFRMVYEKRKTILGEKHSDTLRVLRHIGETSLYLKKDNESLKILQEVLDIQNETLDPSHPDILITLFNIGNLFFMKGKLIKAFQLFQDGLIRSKKVFGENHPIILDIENKLKCIRRSLKLIGDSVPNFTENNKKDIHFASSSGDLKTVEDLLKSGIDVNFENKEGRTPLHFAASNGHKDIINMLLKLNADATIVTKQGNTTLHISTNKGFLSIVHILLQHVKQECPENFNNFINAKTISGGTTALHIAAKNGFLEILRSLLKFGAIYNMTDTQNKMPIDYSVNQEIVDLLNLIKETFEYAKIGNMKLLNKLKWRRSDDFVSVLNARDDQGFTAIQLAFRSNQKEIGKSFLKLLKKH